MGIIRRVMASLFHVTRSLFSEIGRSGVQTRVWSGFFLLILAAWTALWVMSAAHPSGGALGALSPGFSSEFWRALCAAGGEEAGPARLFAMWALMGLAMMAPTAVPMLRAYLGLTEARPGALPALAPWGLAAGFLTVWTGFAAFAALAQTALTRSGAMVEGLSVSGWLTAGLLALAGAYQFSPLKAACLSACRAPMRFFLTQWRDGVSGAVRMGLRQGLDCVGCCWALMLLGFVGGTMNLVWMGGATVLMIVEKLPGVGEKITRPLGIALLAASVYVILQTRIV